jgi:hypothetical protein
MPTIDAIKTLKHVAAVAGDLIAAIKVLFG